ncbi:MAG: NTP transferase domain-containing protein, partial [Acidiferrobacterales bacterium]
MSQIEGSGKRVAAIVLAAGRSTRTGNRNKLLVELEGVSLVQRVVQALTGSRVDPIIVVVGHQYQQVQEALADEPVTFTYNPDYAEGMSSSLRRGLAALPEEADAFLICLADMPQVSAAHIDPLIAAFEPTQGREICVPTFRGQRGNPV